VNTDKITRLTEFDTPTVSNGLGKLDIKDKSYGYTGPEVRYLTPEFGIKVGVAVTARLDTTSPGNEPNVGNQFFEWLQTMLDISKGASPLPVFAVIESVGLRPKYTVTIGDIMATQMMNAGAVGCLTNGSVRDVEGLRGVPMPCWGAGLSPMHGQMRWLDINGPVVVDGMTVNFGDIIHADENGAIVLPAQFADQVYDKAVMVVDEEKAKLAAMNVAGWTIEEHLAKNR